MAKRLKILKEVESKRTYQLNDGENIVIEIDEDENRINVFDSNDKEIGYIEFADRDSDDKYIAPSDDKYILTLALDKTPGYTHRGIGREALLFYKEWYNNNIAICAASILDRQLDDGSHLIGDGGPFVMQMRAEGIIAPDPQMGPENEEDYH